MALIVNADDFGKTSQINNAIAECFEKGFINRTTIMINMPFAAEAFDISKERGFEEKVGLHINLTEGKPLTEAMEKNALFCDERGMFNASFYHMKDKRLYMDKKTVNIVKEEIKAQIDLYHKLGFTLNHLDSHHHTHTNLPIIKAIGELGRECDFSSIRQSRNLYRGGNPANRLYKKYYNYKLKKLCKHTTDYFGSYADAIDYFTPVDTFDSDKFVDFCQNNDVEIMVHPDFDVNGNLIDTGVGPINKLLTLIK